MSAKRSSLPRLKSGAKKSAIHGMALGQETVCIVTPL